MTLVRGSGSRCFPIAGRGRPALWFPVSIQASAVDRPSWNDPLTNVGLAEAFFFRIWGTDAEIF